ncbi:hypothetical protein D3C79_723880 [compost metagenome]
MEHCQAALQPLQGLLLVEAVELTFVGVDTAHEVVAGRAGRRAVVGMVIAVQGQFVALSQAPVKQAAEGGRTQQQVALVEVRHHKPGHRDAAEAVDGFDEGLVVRPGLGRNIMQHQHQAT